jgi:GH18 family chitinase
MANGIVTTLLVALSSHTQISQKSNGHWSFSGTTPNYFVFLSVCANRNRRNDIPPSKLVMGYGFYGRSFQLVDASCTKPGNSSLAQVTLLSNNLIGCAFQGSAQPGPCSNAPGILMYYEIMALLKQNPSLASKIVWDRAAAAKYVVYGDGKQWISYDDADTFKQKRDFQEKLGLGGALIWASDAGTCFQIHSFFRNYCFHLIVYSWSMIVALSEVCARTCSAFIPSRLSFHDCNRFLIAKFELKLILFL